jgi:hypothetical protein
LKPTQTCESGAIFVDMYSDFLRKQHEEQRLKHAIEYVHDATRGDKKLTTSELSRLNQIITARKENGWRNTPVELQIPTGQTRRLNVISNPVEDARRILGLASDIANNEDVVDAAVFVYLQLVDEHLFEDANRRTAGLAAQWILNQHDYEIDTLELLELPIADVRDFKVRTQLKEQMRSLIRGK